MKTIRLTKSTLGRSPYFIPADALVAWEPSVWAEGDPTVGPSDIWIFGLGGSVEVRESCVEIEALRSAGEEPEIFVDGVRQR